MKEAVTENNDDRKFTPLMYKTILQEGCLPSYKPSSIREMSFFFVEAKQRVIDNFHESIPLVGLRDNADYYLKDSPYKVKDVFMQYLKQIQHPKTDDIHAAPVKNYIFRGQQNKRCRLCCVCDETRGEIHGHAGTVQLWVFDK
ncbi:hypothetical protein R6Q57_013065 [Mikania cordata]